MGLNRRERKKSWSEKSKLVKECYYRCQDDPLFASVFYEKFFFLNPEVKSYFMETDWEHQRKAFMHALDHLFHYVDNSHADYHREQIVRIAKTHSKANMNIAPHDYYYWIDALIMTLKARDPKWYDDLNYYLRECLFKPISTIISYYLIEENHES